MRAATCVAAIALNAVSAIAEPLKPPPKPNLAGAPPKLAAAAKPATSAAPAASRKPVDPAELQKRARKFKVVRPDSYFSVDALQDFFVANLGEETLRHVEQSNDSVWVFTANVSLGNGSNFCWATMGLTETPPKGRSGRFPASLYASAILSNARGALNDTQLRDCMSDALRGATKEFVAAGLAKQLEGLDKTREAGPRKKEPKDPEMAILFSSGLPNDGKAGVFSAISPEFRAAFDYRRLQFFVLADAFTFTDRTLCVGVAGVTARSPDTQNPRFPGFWFTHSRELDKAEAALPGASERCRSEASAAAVKRALEESWDDRGLLDAFKMTEETGVPLVANYKPKVGPSPEAVAAAQFRRDLKVGSDSHCGLVIEVRRPIAKVQSMIGEVWLKVAQLYPKGKQSCRFTNGVYQDPAE